MKLASVFGHEASPRFNEPWDGWPLPRCNIGLEWEFENGPFLRQTVNDLRRNPYLTTHDDGSLRDNGVEIVTVGDGLYGKDLLAAIDLMRDAINKTHVKPVCNFRTGFHVHIDIRDMEEGELHNMLLLYCLLEKPIFNFVGKDRWKSNFCVPWFRSDAQFTLLKLIELAGGFSRDILNGIGQRIKGLQRYSALNCQAIAKLGTLEFRHMENSIDEIATKQIDFIRIVMHLKRLACWHYAEGRKGASLFEYAKQLTPDQLIKELQFQLPYTIDGWDYPDALMQAIGLVNFDKAELDQFVDSIFSPFYGTHPNFR